LGSGAQKDKWAGAASPTTQVSFDNFATFLAGNLVGEKKAKGFSNNAMMGWNGGRLNIACFLGAAADRRPDAKTELIWATASLWQPSRNSFPKG